MSSLNDDEIRTDNSQAGQVEGDDDQDDQDTDADDTDADTDTVDRS